MDSGLVGLISNGMNCFRGGRREKVCGTCKARTGEEEGTNGQRYITVSTVFRIDVVTWHVEAHRREEKGYYKYIP